MSVASGQRIARAVQSLPIPQPFTIEAFVAAIADQLDRRIELVATRCLTGACGVLLRTPQVDFICYDGRDSPVSASRTVAHEVGHLLLGHPLMSFEVLAQLAAGFPDLPPALVQSIVNRSIRGQRAEEEADLFADHVMARALSVRRAPAPLLTGMHAAFE